MSTRILISIEDLVPKVATTKTEAPELFISCEQIRSCESARHLAPSRDDEYVAVEMKNKKIMIFKTKL